MVILELIHASSAWCGFHDSRRDALIRPRPTGLVAVQAVALLAYGDSG